MARKGKMKAGECRHTKTGQKFCKRNGRVRFVKGGAKGFSGSRRGKVCIRKKRVRSASGKLVLRCAKFSK